MLMLCAFTVSVSFSCDLFNGICCKRLIVCESFDLCLQLPMTVISILKTRGHIRLLFYDY